MADAFDRLAGNKTTNTSTRSGGDAFSRLGSNSAPKKSKSLISKATGGGLHVLGGVLDVLGRPGEAVLSAGRAGAESKGNNNPITTATKIAGGFKRGLTGQEHLTPTQAVLGRDVTSESAYGNVRSARGIAGRLADFTAAVATDPTTILFGGSKEAVSAGARGLEKTALKQATEKGLSEEAALAAAKSVTDTAASKGIKAAYKEVGGRENVLKTLKETATESGVQARRNPVQLLAGAGKDETANAERFAKRSLKALEKRGGLPETAIGRATIGTENVAKEAVGKAVGKIGDTAPLRLLDRAFHSEAAIRQEHGSEVAAKFKEAKSARDAAIVTKVQENEIRAKAALREAGNISRDGDKTILAAIESPEGRKALEQTEPKLLPMYDALTGIKSDMAKSRVLTGQQELFQKDIASRAFTRSAQKAMKNEEKFAQVIADVSKSNADNSLVHATLNPRKLFPNKTVAEANAILEPKLRDAGLLKPGEKFFKEEAITPTLAEAGKAAEETANQQYVKDLMKIKDPSGKSILQEAGPNVPSHYQQIKLANGQVVHGPKAIINDLKKVEALTTNSEDIKLFHQTMQQWSRFWKQGATVLPVGGAFTGRNARSNVMLNFIGDVKDVRDYIQGGKIQKTVFKTLRDPKNQDALVHGKLDSVLESALGKRDFRLYKEMQDHDIIGSTFSSHDLGALRESHIGDKTKNPWTKLTRVGASGNQIVEENARMAHYIAKRNQGATAEEAALSVKKYLFDYGDLSDLEKHVLKIPVPFYTFLRKNTPLQLEKLIKNPGKYTLRGHIVNATTGNPDENTPDYLKEGRQLPPALAALLGSKNPVVTTPDNPLQAALDQGVKPITQPLSLIPGVKRVIPEDLRAKDKAEVGRTLAGIPSGPQLGALKYLAEDATGKSLFTGYNLKPGAKNELQHAISAATPAYSRGQSVTKGLTDKERRRMALIQLLTGLKTTSIKK